MPEIPPHRSQRILLHHPADLAKLLPHLFIIDARDESRTLSKRQIRPVDALGSVRVVGLEQVLEDDRLVVGIVLVRVRRMVVAGLGAVRDGYDAGLRVVMAGMAQAVEDHGC